MCVCPLSLRNYEDARLFSQMMPDEHPRRHHLAYGPLSSLYAPLRSLSSFGATSVTMCCTARPVSSSAPSVLHEDRIGRNVKYVRRFCNHIHVLHICDRTCIVSKLGWRCTTGRLIFGPPPLYPSHPPTPPPSRWPALSTLPLLARFMLA